MPAPVDLALLVLVKESTDFSSTIGTGLTCPFLTILLHLEGAPLLKSSRLLDTNLHLAPSRAVQYLDVFRNFSFSLSLYLSRILKIESSKSAALQVV